MTAEQRTLIAANEITGVQFHCPECQTKSIIPLNRIEGIPKNCGNCNAPWYSGMDEMQTVKDFLLQLREFRSLPSGVKIKFELRGG